MRHYARVIPRDLFNEASLLKMLGKLVLNLESYPEANCRLFPDSVRSFDIEQMQESGAITVTNLHFEVRGQRYRLSRPLNSREDWPLYLGAMNIESDFEEISVFEDDGGFTNEMIEFIHGR